MKSFDFNRSFITFVTKGRANNARIQVKSCCKFINLQTGSSENYYLIASCKGEDTYGVGPLFLNPSYDFCIIYSPTDFMIIRTYGNAARNNTTAGENREHFLDVHFNLRLVDAELLPDNESIVKATFSNRIINGRTEIVSADGLYSAIIEFPVKTMNVNDIRWLYQVDTGPILLPDFESNKGRVVERFQLAYVAYNKENEAYFVIQEPTSIASVSGESDLKVSHYSRVIRMESRNSVIAL